MRTGAAALILLILVPAGNALALRGAAYRGPPPPPPLEHDPMLPGRATGRHEDVMAFWPYFFEHDKEWILAGRMREARKRRKDPEALRARIRPVLVEALGSPKGPIRDAAVVALGKTGRDEAVRVLLAALADRESVVREDAVLALGLTGSSRALGPLRALLDDEVLAPWAALALALVGDPDSMPPLRDRFDPNAEGAAEPTACCIATAIGSFGDKASVPVLAGALRRTRDGDRLRASTCTALARIDGEPSRDLLLRAAQDRYRLVAGAAMLGLGSFRGDASVRLLEEKGLRSGDRMVHMFSIWSLASLGRYDTLKPIAEQVAKSKYASQHAALALGVYGSDAASDKCAWLLSGKGRFPLQNLSAAAMSLGLLRDKRTLELLVPLLHDEKTDADTRGYYAFALGLCGDPKARPTILVAMDNDAPAELLRSACWALGLIGNAEDVPRLLRLLRGEGTDDKYVRGAAAIALGLIGDDSAVEPLIALAKTADDSSTRAFALAALGWLADSDDVPRIPLLFERIHDRAKIPIVKEVLSIL